MKSAFLFTLLALSMGMGCNSQPKQDKVAAAPVAHLPLPMNVEQAVASPFRTDSNRARDKYRHPVETLEFFGIRPNMTVVEISPGAGWYLEILAPLLATEGHYISAMAPLSANAETNEGTAKILEWERAHPEVSAKITSAGFAPPNKLDIASRGTVDMVLTFRNVHNWMAKGSEKAAFQAFFDVLKPGGVLGVVEHRANPKQKHDKKAKSGYVREKDVIKLAKSVGFQLVDKSEINANPKDTKDYPNGVWTLPPTLQLKEKDRDRYLAIGESDRMTLKFIKPLSKK